MHITLERAMDGLFSFMSDQVSTIANMGERFLGYAVVGALKKNPAPLMSKIKSWLEMAGVLNDGMVDLDVLKAALDSAFAAVPKVSYLGFSFTVEDATALLAKMQ